MKKVLVTMLMLLFASSAYAAATFTMTGDYTATGRWWYNYQAGLGTDYNSANATSTSNPQYDPTDPTDNSLGHSLIGSFGYFEQDINLYPKITFDNTSLNFRICITDVSWGTDGTDDGEESIQNGQTTNDDNIDIERAYLKHKFNDTVSVDVGLQDGAAFGTSFGDDVSPRWRIKFTEVTKAGIFLQIYEKNVESGKPDAGATRNKDKDDGNSYGLAWIGKAGPITIKQLLWWSDASHLSANNDYRGVKIFNPKLAINGDLGPIGMEGEIDARRFAFTEGITGVSSIGGAAHQDDQNWWTYGLYLNIWAKALDAMTPGMVLAYGSFKNDICLASPNRFQGFDFGDDFNSTLILGDEMAWGGNGRTGVTDLYGMSMIKLYLNDIKTPVKALTLNGYYAYIKSNQGNYERPTMVGSTVTYVYNGVISDSEKNLYHNAHAWEAGVGANYKITENLAFTPYFSYASITYSNPTLNEKYGEGNWEQPAPIWLAGTDLSFTF